MICGFDHQKKFNMLIITGTSTVKLMVERGNSSKQSVKSPSIRKEFPEVFW